MKKLFPHTELDRALDEATGNPEAFGSIADRLIAALDASDADLEITDPLTWRRGGGVASKTSFVQQFRADVDSIVPMNRAEESQLARRIEFARLRLEGARKEASDSARWRKEEQASRVLRRATELHALRSEMVERNLYLVLINVDRYDHTGTNRLDLIQEGCVSLFRAVDGFDWRRGLLFRTYAVHWLNQAFRNYVYNHGHTVRVPVYLQKALKLVNEASNQLGKPKASPSEIAASSDLSESLVSSALSASRSSYSLDAQAGDSSEGSRLRELLVDPGSQESYRTEFEDVSLEQGLSKAFAHLSERERLVLRMRFGLDGSKECTLAGVADHLGVSVERVRQIQVRALGKLDTPLLRRELDPFLN